MAEAFPPDKDRPHIKPLAQAILDTVQPYAAKHGLELQTVMSSIGTAAGAMLARAYRDPNVVDEVASRLSIAAREMALVMIDRDVRSGRRKQ